MTDKNIHRLTVGVTAGAPRRRRRSVIGRSRRLAVRRICGVVITLRAPAAG